MENYNKITELCKELLRKTDDNILRNIITFVKAEADGLKENLDIKKFNLVFHGEVGVGKTTAICHLFNLLLDDYGDEGKKLKDAPLLSTSSGKTTLAETTIAQTDNETKIEIIPMGEREFDSMLTDFCQHIIGVKQETPLEEEQRRAIENMIGIQKEKEKTFEETLLSLFLIDKIEENALKRLFEKTKEKINYKGRVKTQITNIETKEEFKRRFSDINEGKCTDIPFPKKLNLFIGKDFINMCFPENIVSIVDNKGITTDIREDIDDSIRKADNINIFCNSVSSLAENNAINQILARNLYEEARYYFTRVAFVGLEKSNELEETVDAENRKDGEKKRRREAVNSFKKNKITIDENNIFFFDSWKGYNYNNKKIVTNSDLKQIENENNSFIQNIDKLVSRRTLFLEQEQCAWLERLLSIESENIIDPETLGKFGELRRLIEKHKNEKRNPSDYIKKIKKYISDMHVGKIRGMVNRNGRYDEYDIYINSGYIGADTFEQIIKSYKDVIVGNIQTLFSDSTNKLNDICQKALESKVSSTYSCNLEENKEFFKRELDEKFSKSRVWIKCQQLWGQGAGYRQNVCRHLSEGITDSGADKSIGKSLFYYEFFSELLQFIKF